MDVYKGEKMRRKGSDSLRIGDSLNLAENAGATEVLKEAGEVSFLFSAKAIKINRRLKLQERVFVLTEHALYNFKDDSCKTLLRRIDYKDIGSVAVSPFPDNYFVLRVPYEKRADYFLKSTHKTEMLSLILREGKAYAGKPIVVEIGEEIPYRLCTGDINILRFTMPDVVGDGVLRLEKEGSKRYVPVLVDSKGDDLEEQAGNNDATLATDSQSSDEEATSGSKGDAGSSAGPFFGKKAEVLFDYEACSPNEITLEKGQTIQVLDEHDDGWWVGVVEGSSRPPGLFPSNYTSVVEESSFTPKEVEGRKVRALFDYEASNSNELDLTKGQIVVVVEEMEDRWWKGVPEGSSDEPKMFPSNYTTTIT